MIAKALRFRDQKAFTAKFNSKILEIERRNLEIRIKNNELNNQVMQKQYLGIPITEEIKYENETAITNEIVIDELHEMKSELVILLKLIDTTMIGILKYRNLSDWKNIINIINSEDINS